MTLVDRARIIALVIAGGIAATISVARAQSAEAEALFRDGRNLIKAGKLAAGCDRLAASERLESSIGTLLNLGDCREKLGKLASAWAAFRKAEAMAKRSGGDDRRQAEAARRAVALEPRLSNLVIDVGHVVDGLVVRRDGEVVDDATWNTALPVDPGSYTIVAEAPGHAPWRTSLVIGAGDRRRVVSVPLLEPVATAAPPPGPEPAPRYRLVAVPVARRTWTTTRAISAVFAVSGAGALGTGIYFGVHARNLDDRANQRCPGAACSDPEGLRLNDQAKTSAMRANVLYVAGGATLATAAVLWFLGAPGEVAVVPAAGDHQLGVAMTGRF
jgi:hypothetical protein